jgi:hypothetical protein
MVCCCEHGNESSVSIKGGDFLTSGMNVSFSIGTSLNGVSFFNFYKPL